MTIWFLAFLGLVWAVVVMPAMLRARRASPLPAALRFKNAMRQVAPVRAPRERVRRPTSGRRRRPPARYLVVPKDDHRLECLAAHRRQVRRRRSLGALAILAALTGGAALVWRGDWIAVHLLSDAAVLSYVVVLIEAARRRKERALKIRRIPSRRTAEIAFDRPLRVADGS